MYRYKMIHYEHLMIAKSCEVGVLEKLYLSPWYNDIFVEYTCICTLNGILVYRSYVINVVVFVFKLIILIK